MNASGERANSSGDAIGRIWRIAIAGVALTALALLASGCGGVKAPSVANLATTTATVGGGSTASSGTGESGSTAPPSSSALLREELAYAKCMRANGAPNFPDPGSGGGFEIAGNGRSPGLEAAQAKCQKFMPVGGGPGGSGPPPSAQTMAQWLVVAQCMRHHGVPDFPDPTTKVPAPSPAIGEISDRDGVILAFPHTIDMQSPLFLRAAANCGFQLTNH
jgi:hypothetical protein